MPKTLFNFNKNFIHINEGERTDEIYNGGNGFKFTWFYKNTYYMVKSQERNKRLFRDLNNKPIISYNNSVLSEYVASHIINAMHYKNIKTQETFLVTNGEDTLVACKHFTYNEEKLTMFISADSIIKRVGIENGWDYYNNYESLTIQEGWGFFYDQDFINKDWYLNYFWDMFMIDAFLLNWDRNPTNWGVLKQNNGLNYFYKPAPLFDQGSTLFSKHDSSGFELINENNIDDIKTMINNTSSYFHDDILSGRIVYDRFLKETKDQQCIKAMNRFLESVNIDDIINTINDLNLPLKYKKSYEILIKISYEQMINRFKTNPLFSPKN